MTTIYKYRLPEFGECELEIPGDFQRYKVGIDPAGNPCIWAIVDTDKPEETAKFYVGYTGHELPKFVDTWIGSFAANGLMLHVFTVSENEL